MKTSLLVLAAGMGARFGGIKQTTAVGASGETLLEYSVYDATGAGFDEIVFLVRRSMEKDFASIVLSRLPPRIKARLVFQEPDSPLGAAGHIAAPRAKPWGTGQALLCASGALDSPFAVINADDFYGRPSFEAVHAFLASNAIDGPEYCMAGFRLADTMSPHGAVSRGVCELDVQGYLKRVVEHLAISMEGSRLLSRLPGGDVAELAADTVVSMNLWGFTPSVFEPARRLFAEFLSANASSPVAEFYLPGLVNEIVAAGTARLRVLPTSGPWFGLTFREDLELARTRIAALAAAGEYPSPLWAERGSAP
jgi:hypothetical protein